jgi:hypothetical protein
MSEMAKMSLRISMSADDPFSDKIMDIYNEADQQ